MTNRRIRIDIRDWLELHFDNVDTATSPDVRLNCPFCNDQKGRLYIAYEDGKDERKGDGWCHNEQRPHSFFELFAMLENITDGEAAHQLFDENPEPTYGKADEAWAEYMKPKLEEQEQKTRVIWPSHYVSLFKLTPKEWQKRIPKYMTNRRITQSMCDSYLLGYCTQGRFGGRIIVPIYQNEELVGFQGRAMHDALKPKYMFMTGVIAGDYLFNLDNVPSGAEEVILNEGVFDVWGVIRCGFPNVVASFGKHLTEKGVKTLVTRFKSVLILWDMDALPEIVALAQYLEGMIRVRVSFLRGKDPDEAEPEAVKEAIANARDYDRAFEYDMLMDTM